MLAIFVNGNVSKRTMRRLTASCTSSTSPQPEYAAVGQFHGVEEAAGGFWRGLLLRLGLLATLAGCGGPDERLVDLDARIKALDGQMKLGEVREVPLPTIKQGEWIVAIAGQYGGIACEPSPLSEKAKQRVTLDYGSSESYPAFLLLVAGERVASSMALSIATSPSAVWSQTDKGSCALIAGPNHHSLVVECQMPVSDKPSGRACEVVLRAVK